jgi:hypothetical protein
MELQVVRNEQVGQTKNEPRVQFLNKELFQKVEKEKGPSLDNRSIKRLMTLHQLCLSRNFGNGNSWQILQFKRVNEVQNLILILLSNL